MTYVLTHRTVESFEDVTQNFEQLEAQSKQLAALSSALATGTIAGGLYGPITAGAGVSFNVPHGLASTPKLTLAMPYGFSGILQALAPTSTNAVFSSSVGLTANSVMWLAIG